MLGCAMDQVSSDETPSSHDFLQYSVGLRFTIFVFRPPRASEGPVLTPGSLETPSGHLLCKKKRYVLSGPT